MRQSIGQALMGAGLLVVLLGLLIGLQHHDLKTELAMLAIGAGAFFVGHRLRGEG